MPAFLAHSLSYWYLSVQVESIFFAGIIAEKDIVSFNFIYIKLKAVNYFILIESPKTKNYMVNFPRIGTELTVFLT